VDCISSSTAVHSGSSLPISTSTVPTSNTASHRFRPAFSYYIDIRTTLITRDTPPRGKRYLREKYETWYVKKGEKFERKRRTRKDKGTIER
jgi:hypothetical protein